MEVEEESMITRDNTSIYFWRYPSAISTSENRFYLDSPRRSVSDAPIGPIDN